MIGAQRSGTSSLYKWLEGHPDVAASVRKEVEYFSTEHWRGESWYRAHFASRARHAWARRRGHDLLAFEATPDYLFHPLAPARAAALVPDAKLVVLLRDPARRAVSHYEHERRHQLEKLSFDEAIEREESRIAPDITRLETEPDHPVKTLRRYSYLARGRYAEQLERWLAHYGRDQLFVVRSEDLYDDPRATFAAITRFLGLRDRAPRSFRNQSTALGTEASPAHEARLRAYFRPHNERLYELLGRDLGWN